MSAIQSLFLLFIPDSWSNIYNQVGGWTLSFGKVRKGQNLTYLTFATVRGAAHEVPYTSPSQALTLFQAFLRSLLCL